MSITRYYRVLDELLAYTKKFKIFGALGTRDIPHTHDIVKHFTGSNFSQHLMINGYLDHFYE